MTRTLLTNLSLAAMTADRPYGLIEDGAVAIRDGRIAFAGPVGDFEEAFDAFETRDMGGRLVTPALIDCHTHLVFGGNRAREFEMRLEGATYEEIARAGGGIVSTVSATREVSQQELARQALPRLDAMIAEGVGTVEIKSGYGLTVEDELKMLRAARELGRLRHVRVKTSYLAAHAVPAEYKGRADAYIDEVVLPGMEVGAEEGLIDAVDGFCEGIAFSPDADRPRLRQGRSARPAGQAPCRAIVGSWRGQAGGMVRRAVGRSSGISGRRRRGGDGGRREPSRCCLPGAFYTLREKQMPPVEALRAAGVPIAVATDCNPGSSPLASPLLAMNMAATLFRLTPEEALAGMTRNAARALGLGEEIGTIEAGKRAELAVWDVEHPAELVYRIGFNALSERIVVDS